MYSFIWRNLPGPWPIKLLITVVVLSAIFLLLMEVVFPLVSSMMPYNDVAV